MKTIGLLLLSTLLITPAFAQVKVKKAWDDAEKEIFEAKKAGPMTH